MLSRSDRARSPGWTAWSSASNTFWRTGTPHTSSAATSLPRTASAARMLHRGWRGKTGEWRSTLSGTSVSLETNTKLNLSPTVLQSDVLCGACSQECHGTPSSDEKATFQSVS